MNLSVNANSMKTDPIGFESEDFGSSSRVSCMAAHDSSTNPGEPRETGQQIPLLHKLDLSNLLEHVEPLVLIARQLGVLSIERLGCLAASMRRDTILCLSASTRAGVGIYR